MSWCTSRSKIASFSPKSRSSQVFGGTSRRGCLTTCGSDVQVRLEAEERRRRRGLYQGVRSQLNSIIHIITRQRTTPRTLAPLQHRHHRPETPRARRLTFAAQDAARRVRHGHHFTCRHTPLTCRGLWRLTRALTDAGRRRTFVAHNARRPSDRQTSVRRTNICRTIAVL